MKTIRLSFLIFIVMIGTSCSPSWKSAVPDYRTKVSVYSKMMANCKDSMEECQRLYEKTYGGCTSSNVNETGRCWDEMTVTYH